MVDTIVDVFAANLKRYRTIRKLSQRDLYSLTGIDNADISRMENGCVNITLKTLEQFARALGINEWELLVPRE